MQWEKFEVLKLTVTDISYYVYYKIIFQFYVTFSGFQILKV